MPGDTSRDNGRRGGRPAGSLNVATIDKALLREELRRYVQPHIQDMVDAQINHAKGVSYMILRNPDGTFTRATDVKQIDAACALGESAFKIFTQAPNTQAFTDLMNRTLDKPAEQEMSVKISGELEVVTARLVSARKRLAERP